MISLINIHNKQLFLIILSSKSFNIRIITNFCLQNKTNNRYYIFHHTKKEMARNHLATSLFYLTS